MANLGKPEFMEVPNPAAPFLSAFAVSAGINNKRRQLEEQLIKMQMQDHEKQQQLEQSKANYASLATLREAETAGAYAKASAVTDKADKATDHANEIVEFQKAISGISAEPGTKDYMTQLNVVRSQFPRLLATPDGQRLWSDNFNTHKYTAGQMVQSQKAVAADYLGQMKSEKLNPYWLENPDQWVYIDSSGKETKDPKNATKRALKFTTDESHNLLLASPDTPSKEVKAWKTLPSNRFDQMVQQHNAYKGIVNGIITGNQEPDISNASGPPTKIKVEGPDGAKYMLPSDQLDEAIRQGYKPAQ